MGMYAFLMALRKLTTTCGALAALLAITYAAVHDDGTPSAQAADKSVPHAPRTALLATHPGAELTSLFLVDAVGSSALAPVSTFAHLPDATVRAAIIPGKTEVLATADTTPSRDASFNASLFHLRPHNPPERIVDRVVHASRPLVTQTGRVFVSRGEPGAKIEGHMRVDSLAIDEIDLGTGQTRTVHQTNGYLLFLVGAIGSDIVLYRIFPDRADIVAIDPDTLAERPIVKSLPPFARDFSIDEKNGLLVFQNRHESDSHAWVVERVELGTGKTNRLFSGPSMTLAPFALPQGGVVFNPRGQGLSPLDTSLSVIAPLGAGVDVIAASTADGRWLAALHTRPSTFAVPFIVDTKTGAWRVLPAPPNTRVAVAGFVVEGGAP